MKIVLTKPVVVDPKGSGLFQKIISAQVAYITKHYGINAAESANYGYWVLDNEICTKIFHSRLYLTSYLSKKSGEVIHSLK